MDCCGHAVTRRWWMWGSVMASVGAMVGGGVGRRAGAAAAETSDAAPAALEILRKSISVDVHTHGGMTGITSTAPPSDDLANAMRAGSLAVACLADVPDGPILGRNAEGVLAALRAPEPGHSIGTISNASPGWTKWSPTMASFVRLPRLISRRRIKQGSPRS